MGVVSVLPGGSSASFPSSSRHRRAKRGVVRGWTADAARRMVQFLWSVDTERLSGQGFAVTLTVGVTPDSSTDWADARALLLQWLRDRHAVRWQWLTEWTRRGRPHMHLCVYGDVRPEELALAWLRICQSRGWDATWRAQTVEPLHDVDGWLKYVAKHSARGVDHYQRDTPPEGWVTTGRLWGRGGDWPVAEPFKIALTSGQTFAFMGHFVSWQATRMRAEGVPEEVVRDYVDRASAGIGHHDIRGLSGWIPYAECVKLLLLVTESPDWGVIESE